MTEVKTLQDARAHLDDLLISVRRTQRLYVDLAPKDESLPVGHRHGFFEPTLFCFCWMDYLGALYLGQGRAGDQTRITGWLRSPYMVWRNELYRERAETLHCGYRDGLVHGYAPATFYLAFGDPRVHLTERGDAVVLDVPTLIEDLISAVAYFRDRLASMPKTDDRAAHGSLEAFWQGHDQVRKRV